MERQKTLKSSVSIRGVGIHTGLPSVVTVKPAEKGSGINFVRTDIDPSKIIKACLENIENCFSEERRQTALNREGIKIRTLEHLMATFHGLGIDNAWVEIAGEELPALDGSAKEYTDKFLEIGLVEQEAEKEFFRVREPFYLEDEKSSIVILPAETFSISYTLSFNHPSLNDQFASFEVTPDLFQREIAPARTFCLQEEAELLLAKGYGRGANYENTLVFKDNLPLKNILRFDNEAARHKILDIIGDLYLLGQPFKGHVISYRSGHSQNIELIKKLARLPSKKEKEGSIFFMNTDNPGQMLDKEAIKKIIPHREPFLFIDRIESLEPGKKAVGIKKITGKEYFFEGHFPSFPIMPGVLIIEAMAQVGGVIMLGIPENSRKMPYFMSIDNAKFRNPVFPGDELRMEVEITRVRAKTGQCLGKAYVGNKLVCEIEVKFALAERLTK